MDIRALLAEALHMGDEGHNRNKAGSIIYTRKPRPLYCQSRPQQRRGCRHLKISRRQHAQRAQPSDGRLYKAMCDTAHGIEGSTIVSAINSNGTNFGIRVSGLGDQWFTAPCEQPDGLYFPGYSIADANPDIGDGPITETAGIGGFAMAAAPAIVTFVSGKPSDAINTTMEMYEITFTEHKSFDVPR